MQVKTIIIALAGLMTVATAAQAELKSFKVNGETVSVEQQKKLYDAAVAQGQPAGPELERYVKQKLIQDAVLIQEAKKANVEKDGEYKEALEQLRNQLMVNVWTRKLADGIKIKDEDIKKAYDADKASYGDTEYQVRRILVKTEDQAKNLIKRINNGSDFGKLATEFSEDAATKQSGGLLGWVVPRYFAAGFSSAFTALKPGDVAQVPVRSPDGWFVVKLENKRAAENYPSYDSQKARIKNALIQVEIQKKVQEAIKNAKVQ